MLSGYTDFMYDSSENILEWYQIKNLYIWSHFHYYINFKIHVKFYMGKYLILNHYYMANIILHAYKEKNKP